ncbi:hypothetical protein KIN20_000401 [Parelaphostrongylus tenuis]|uniref:Uncharacterized protein n=1 Tax=Parelaphostrongylus tenuis TaxID=148309 RepID=A0AAD5MB57_PARTN|nr:hypothetical protein KIN20_000401 [Parelaphostrongylus tenuis]
MPAMKRDRRYKKPNVEEVADEIYSWVVQKREEDGAVKVNEIKKQSKEVDNKKQSKEVANKKQSKEVARRE